MDLAEGQRITFEVEPDKKGKFFDTAHRLNFDGAAGPEGGDAFANLDAGERLRDRTFDSSCVSALIRYSAGFSGSLITLSSARGGGVVH